MRERSLALPLLGFVVSFAAVGVVWFDRPAGEPSEIQAARAAGPGDLAASPAEKGTAQRTLAGLVGPLAAEVEAPAPGPAEVATTGSGLKVGQAEAVPFPVQVADAVGARVPLFSGPGDGEPAQWLDNPTWEGLDVVFVVHERRGDWLRVQVSMRPNQATAWVRASDVELRSTDYQIVVDATNLRLVLYEDRRPVFEAPVAVGKGSTPTPTGNFFVDGIVALTDTSGPYGSHQISVAGFSEVYTSFGGGIGQIALHGTNQPTLLGTPVSNGCVRMTNDAIAHLASLVPTGTPVQIVA